MWYIAVCCQKLDRTYHNTLQHSVCFVCGKKNSLVNFFTTPLSDFIVTQKCFRKVMLLRVPILGLTRRLFRGDQNNSPVISFTTSLSDFVVTQKFSRQVCIITSPCFGVNKTTVLGSSRRPFWALTNAFLGGKQSRLVLNIRLCCSFWGYNKSVFVTRPLW